VINAAPAVVTVYDMQPFLNLARYSVVKRIFLRWRMRSAVRRAAWLLPMSYATKAALEEVLYADPARCTVIPPVVEGRFKPALPKEIDEFRSVYRLPPEFWLYVANFYPHKNHVALLHAYCELKVGGAAPWPLVLRGEPGGAERQIHAAVRELSLQNDVIFLSRLDRRELPTLYGCASAMVFPSTYEGGGIPLVEAMACGCPVVASDLPVVREVTGKAAVYFDPQIAASIVAAMRQSQSSCRLREQSRALGLRRAAHFRAQEVVPALIKAYAHASKGTPQ
jgi:glycosyltransferase involved in cell wall biosynthesis